MSSQPIQSQSLRVEDFSGGITDYYIGSPDPSQYQKADNFLIDENKDLITRPGSEIYDADAPQMLTGNANVNAVIEAGGEVYQHSGRQINYILSGTMTEAVGPTSNKVFPSGTETAKGSFAVWNDHLFAATDQLANPMRIYKNESSAVKVNNLGLPYIELYNYIELANDLKAKYNAHIADASDHTASVDAVNVITAANATDFDSLVTLVAELLTDYDAHDADAEAGTPTYHAATEASDHSLETITSPTSLFEIGQRLTDLKAKYNAHDADATAHGVGSNHQTAKVTSPTVTVGGAGGNSYVYAFHFSHTYNIGDVQFKESGPVVYVSLASSAAPESSAISITNLPTLVNGTTNNYDTSAVKIEIYRTQTLGDTFYYVGEVTNATTSYSDSLADSNLVNNQVMYTEGGVLDNEPPPKAKHIALVNDTLCLGNIKEGTIKRPSRARFSKVFQPYACPSEFFIDFDDDITGIGQINIYPIYFLENKCYRLEGVFDGLGRGGFQKREISTRVGCVSARSIVQVKEGLVFASEDGFYFTDGFTVEKISKNLNETYAALSAKEDICGAYDKKRNIICWGVKSDSSSEANDTVYVGHGNYRTSNSDVPFTTWSGGNLPANFSVTCLAYINETLVRGDHRGYLLKHSNNVFTDPNIDTTVAVANWYTNTIIYDYRSIAYDFGSGDKRKWVSKIVINADNETSLSLAISSNNDNSGVFSSLANVTDKSNLEWGDPTVVWQDGSLRWNYYPTISVWRRFPYGGLRCQYKQIKFTNAYTTIDDSTVIGNVDVDSGTNTVSLNSYPTFTWIPDAAGYYISFDDDSYTNEFLIESISGGDIVVANGESLLSDLTGASFRIKGYKKREVLNLLNYVIQFGFMTTTQDQYRADSTT